MRMRQWLNPQHNQNQKIRKGCLNEQEDHISDTINLCIDEEMGGNEDEEDEDEYEEDDDGNELRPVRPTEAKPSKEVNPK